MKRLFVVLTLAAFLPTLQAADDSVTVTALKKALEVAQAQSTKSNGTNPAPSPLVDSESHWAGIGKEIGVAVNAGLRAVVDQSERFGATRVGNFVMLMVFWKVAGQTVLHVILGIPIMLGGIFLWMWSLRHFFWPTRILIKNSKESGKEWKITDFQFKTSDGRGFCGAAHGIVIIVWLLVMLGIIFN